MRDVLRGESFFGGEGKEFFFPLFFRKKFEKGKKNSLKNSKKKTSPQAEVREVVRIGYLNGLFVLARAIGLIGHALDQQRLRQPLYRHPW